MQRGRVHALHQPAGSHLTQKRTRYQGIVPSLTNEFNEFKYNLCTPQTKEGSLKSWFHGKLLYNYNSTCTSIYIA